MIAYLSGKLADKRPTEAIIDVNGVGYRVHIPTSTFEHLPEVGRPVMLHTHHHVREDAILLYGFFSDAERKVFEVMLGVTGIGPKLALAALSAMSPAELREHVLRGEAAMLTSIPGVGRKTAERLIIELRDRFADMEPMEAAPRSGVSDERREARADALAALESLGFSRAAAEKNLRKVMRDRPDLQAAEDLIRLALREQ
ncbi:MAG: Holliday junction branch migration protein RuvA [Rhodothermales bacterium]